METAEEYEKRLNAITFGSFHGYEFLKYCKWVLKQEKQMNPKIRNIHQNCLPSLSRYIEEISKVIDLQEHEEMSVTFDDLNRLMVKKPHLKDIIMQEVEKAVTKYENNQSDWIEVTHDTEIKEGSYWVVNYHNNEVFQYDVNFGYSMQKNIQSQFINNFRYYQPIIPPTFIK